MQWECCLGCSSLWGLLLEFCLVMWFTRNPRVVKCASFFNHQKTLTAYSHTCTGCSHDNVKKNPKKRWWFQLWNYCVSELSAGLCLDFILYTHLITYITHSRLLLKLPHICADVLSKTCLLYACHSLTHFQSKLKPKIRVKWPLISCQGNGLSHHSAFKLILTENSTQGQTVVITYLLKTTSEKCLYSYKNK